MSSKEVEVVTVRTTGTNSQNGKDEEEDVNFDAMNSNDTTNRKASKQTDEDEEGARINKNTSCCRRSNIISYVVTHAFHGLFDKYPRICTILGGIFIPMLFITLVSLFFGHLLANVEAPSECDSNDAYLAHHNALQQYQLLLFRLITEIPVLCYEAVFSKEVEQELELFWNELQYYLRNETGDMNSTATSLSSAIEELDNVTSLFGATMPSKEQVDEEFHLAVAEGATPMDGILDLYLTRQMKPDNPHAVPGAASLAGHLAHVATHVTFPQTNTLQEEPETSSHVASVINNTEMLQYMQQCGKTFVEVAHESLNLFTISTLGFDGGLTFNWNRCVDRSSGGFFSYLGIPFENERNASSRENQEDYYYELWKQDLERIWVGKINDSKNSSSIDDGSTDPRSSSLYYLVLYIDSLTEASGRMGCEPNSPATAWFWFTIMTTVGYGNQAPVTQAGRALVFTFGLLSILIFAAVLSSSGSIIIIMWSELMLFFYDKRHVGRDRSKSYKGCKAYTLILFTSPFASCAFWGALWYVYMVFTAWYAHHYWNDITNVDSVSFGDSYWFAYVTTTTVGLGDYFVHPEQLFFGDVYMFSILFLFGFILLSSFLEKCHDAMKQAIPKDLGDLLRDRLGDPVQKWEEHKRRERLRKKNAAFLETGNESISICNDKDNDIGSDCKGTNENQHSKQLLESCEQFLKDQVTIGNQDGFHAVSPTPHNSIDDAISTLVKEQELLLKLQQHIQVKLENAQMEKDRS